MPNNPRPHPPHAAAARNRGFVPMLAILTLIAAAPAAAIIAATQTAPDDPQTPTTQPTSATTTQPGEQPQPDAASQTQPTTQPQTQPRKPEDITDDIWQTLGRIEQRAKTIRTLNTRIRWDRYQGLVGDEQFRFGSLIYQAGPPARFAVHLDALLFDRKRKPLDRWYIFDGVHMMDKDIRQRQIIRRRIVPPDAPPSQRNPLALGDGPFPIPLSFDRQRIAQRYRVEQLHPTRKLEDEPTDQQRQSLENTIRLRLTPRRTDVTDRLVEIWYDQHSWLPRRVQFLDESENLSVVWLLIEPDRSLNTRIDEAAFDTTLPADRGWNIEDMPWRDPNAPDTPDPAP